MEEPLNPELYTRLQRYYGEDSVDIIAAGEAISWRLVQSAVSDAEGRRRVRREVINQGEEYRVRCKLCRDHRPRMYINHMWGVWDAKSKSKNLWLVQCFNEQCYDEYEPQAQLYERVYAVPRRGKKKVIILPGREVDPEEVKEAKPPGPMWPLDKLKAKQPKHHAITYLENRGMDVEKLARMWNAAYCPSSHYSLAQDRIIIPIYMNGMLVGWQARYIGDDVDGVPFNVAKVAKYWTMPGFKRRFCPYNMDRAVRHPTVVIVEGPTDVWNQGPMAFGALGKTLALPIRQKLVKSMRVHGSEAVIVIMLDPKQDERDMKKNKPHHIKVLQNQLYKGMQGRVVPVYLPEEFDPGSIDRGWAREIMCEEASKMKLKLSFTRPT